MNHVREDGTAITPSAEARRSVGRQIQFYAELFGVSGVVPFSFFDRYQRSDSVWANQYTTPMTAYADGFGSYRARVLPAFISYELESESERRLRSFVGPESPLFRVAKRSYLFLKRRVG